MLREAGKTGVSATTGRAAGSPSRGPRGAIILAALALALGAAGCEVGPQYKGPPAQKLAALHNSAAVESRTATPAPQIGDVVDGVQRSRADTHRRPGARTEPGHRRGDGAGRAGSSRGSRGWSATPSQPGCGRLSDSAASICQQSDWGDRAPPARLRAKPDSLRCRCRRAVGDRSVRRLAACRRSCAG